MFLNERENSWPVKLTFSDTMCVMIRSVYLELELIP
jgi:hypothetical protein